MRDDYLWDRSGEPDPEIEKLERALAPLGHRGDPLLLPEAVPAREETAPRRGPKTAPSGWGVDEPLLPAGFRLFGLPVRAWALAACLVLVAGAVWLWSASRRPAWDVARLEGAPRVGEGHIQSRGKLPVGEWLVTDASSRAHVTVGSIGELLVEPNTRLRLIASHEREQRLELARGTVTAMILAPPRQFVIDTPSATAVDLGCAYTLEVDPAGGALVTVLAGWVSFEYRGRDAFIPAGARCATRPGTGPGTPYFTDAPPELKNALALLDLASGGPEGDDLLARVLAAARREDAFTLWHLLARSQGASRDAIYARLAALVPPPAGVTLAGVMAGDRLMLDRWWDELGFGEMKWWRLWQRSWPEAGPPGAPKRRVGPA